MQTNFFLLFSFGMQHLCRKVSRKWMEFWEIGPEREGASSIWYVLWSSMPGFTPCAPRCRLVLVYRVQLVDSSGMGGEVWSDSASSQWVLRMSAWAGRAGGGEGEETVDQLRV